MVSAEAEWLPVCRRAAERVRAALGALDDRAAERGRGAGGDTTLAVDAAAEEIVLAELEATGRPLTVISEERGEVALNGGGELRAVVDPVDGSLNAKRGLPFYAVSIAIAGGPAMSDVAFGYVADLAGGAEWAAAERVTKGGVELPALEPGPLEILAVETARPPVLAAAGPAIGTLPARRVRALGSVALALCLVADGTVDAMASLGPVRSIDVAAGQLAVTAAGGVVAFPDDPAPSLDLGMRSRVHAARDAGLLDTLRTAFT